jgi:hypothetical protein
MKFEADEAALGQVFSAANSHSTNCSTTIYVSIII